MRSRKKLKSAPRASGNETVAAVLTDNASLLAPASSSPARADPHSLPPSRTAEQFIVEKDKPPSAGSDECIEYIHPISRESLSLFTEAWSLTKCQCCTGTYRSPVTSKCGHSMCRLCFQEEVYKRSACPVCRVPLRPADFVPNITLDNLVHDLIDLKAILDAHYSSTVSTRDSASVAMGASGLHRTRSPGPEPPSSADATAAVGAETARSDEEGSGIGVVDAIAPALSNQTLIRNEMEVTPIVDDTSVKTGAVGQSEDQTDFASKRPKSSPSPINQSLNKSSFSPNVPASEALVGEPLLAAALTVHQEGLIIKTQSPDASPILFASPTTGGPVISSTFPDYFLVDDNASYSSSDDHVDDSDIELKKEQGAVDSEMIVWSQRDDPEGRLFNHSRTGVHDTEWEESEFYIEQCLSQAAALDAKETANAERDQTTQTPHLSHDQGLSARPNLCSDQGNSTSSAQSVDIHEEPDARFEPGEFTLSPEIEFVAASHFAPAQSPSDQPLPSACSEYHQNGLAVPPLIHSMSHDNEGPSRLNHLDTKGPSVGTLESFTPEYTLDPWAAEIHQELKKLKSALQNNGTQDFVVESYHYEDTSVKGDCSDLGKGSKDLVGEPEVSTCVYDETDRPTIDVVGDNHGVVEAISGFSSKISFQVAAENLSSESELSLAKCAKLELFEYGDLSSFSGYQTNIFVVECKKESGLRLCARSIMYIKAMCVGAFIVDAQWLSDCASLSRVLPPEEYEINGSIEDSVSGGPYKSRVAARDTNGRMELLAGSVFICDLLDVHNITIQATDRSSVDNVSLSQVAWVVYFCGGDVMKKSEANALLKENKISILRPDVLYFRLYFDAATRAAAKAAQSLGSVFVAARSVSWLLNVVCTHSFDRSKYLKSAI